MSKTFEQVRQRLTMRAHPGLLVRLIPKAAFAGSLGPRHRRYVCFGDYEELQGLTVQEAARRLYGGIAATDPEKYGGFMNHNWRVAWNFERSVTETEADTLAYMADEFYVVTVRTDNHDELDLFPGTWKALAYIATDHARMGSAAHVADHLIQLNDGQMPVMEKYGYSGEDFYLFKDPVEQDQGIDPQGTYYAYLAIDSAYANDVLEFFGVDNRCWRGCGYVGAFGEWYARVFLGRNLRLNSSLIHSCTLLNRDDVLPILL